MFSFDEFSECVYLMCLECEQSRCSHSVGPIPGSEILSVNFLVYDVMMWVTLVFVKSVAVVVIFLIMQFGKLLFVASR